MPHGCCSKTVLHTPGVLANDTALGNSLSPGPCSPYRQNGPARNAGLKRTCEDFAAWRQQSFPQRLRGTKVFTLRGHNYDIFPGQTLCRGTQRHLALRAQHWACQMEVTPGARSSREVLPRYKCSPISPEGGKFSRNGFWKAVLRT